MRKQSSDMWKERGKMKSMHPITFSEELIPKILSGAKTQTRRVINPRLPEGENWFIEDGTVKITRYKFGLPGVEAPCPYGYPGDILWVREKWRPWSWWEGEPMHFEYADGSIMASRPGDTILDDDRIEEWEDATWLKVSEELAKKGIPHDEEGHYHWEPDGPNPLSWRTGRFMPKWAHRIQLVVQDVNIQRLQNISPEDCIAEGVEQKKPLLWSWDTVPPFSRLWDRINARNGNGWETNPWVWVVEFSLHENASYTPEKVSWSGD